MFSLSRVFSSIGNAITFSFMVALVSSVAFTGAFIPVLIALSSEGQVGSILQGLAFMVVGIPIATILLSLCLFIPTFFVSFFLCASRSLSKKKFILTASTFGALAVYSTFHIIFWRSGGVPIHGEKLVGASVIACMCVAVAAFVKMSLRLIWEDERKEA